MKLAYDLRTLNGYSFYEMSSLLQKAIRRGDIDRAGFAANELFYKYNKYLWKRLLVCSAEDCYGIMTKEIIALKMADDIVNQGKPLEKADGIFVGKAVTLLCMARKNRDACYAACNFIFLDRTLEPDEIPHVNINECELPDDTIPDWVFDVHTLKGKKMGRTGHDMIVTEEAALKPHQLSLFDNASWEPRTMEKVKRGWINPRTDRQWKEIVEFMDTREADPTHHGEDWPVHEDNWEQIDPPKTTVLHNSK